MPSDKNFLKEYLNDFTTCLNLDEDDRNVNNLVVLKDKILETKNNSGKIIIVGNGGSAAISSHFSVDLTKNAKIRSINFNESDLITCFSNDYGFENWISEALKFYADKNDLLILISSSGKSQNMLNAADTAKNMNLNNVVTFTGFEQENPLSKKGHLNFWVNSSAYNFIENIHQIWLLSVVDLIIGDRHYEA
jgi:D-sedoheptulose 7-phosphate isomerase